MLEPKQLTLPFEPEHTETEAPEILVIGDYLTDRWVECDSVKLSAEAPVIVANAAEATFCHGGAGNVAKNLLEMGWNPIQVHQASRVSCPVKTRYMHKGTQLFRVDEQDKIEWPIKSVSLVAALDKANSRGLPVVVADYNKGALTTQNRKYINPVKYPKIPHWYIHTKLSPASFTYQNSQRTNTTWFYNQKEFSGFHNNETFFYEPIVVTEGAEGATRLQGNIKFTSRASVPGTVRSTCGAGDVFMAAYVTAQELYGHPNPLAIADAIAKKTVTECDYTCVYRGGF